MKIQKHFFFFGGGGGSGVGSGGGGHGRWEQRSFCENSKKNLFFFCWGGVRMDVNEELIFL